MPVGLAVTTVVAGNGRLDDTRAVGFGKDVPDVADVGGERHGPIGRRSRMCALQALRDCRTHQYSQCLFVHGEPMQC